MNNLGNKEIMSKNLQYYMNKFGVNRRKLSADLNIKYTTLSDWINAKTYPRIDKIELLANYFKIQKADLVEEVNSQPLPEVVLPLDKKLGNRVKQFREEKDISQELLVKTLGISLNDLKAYETGQKPFTVDTVFHFADALGVTFDDLFPNTTTEHFDKIPAILYLDEKNNTIITAKGKKYVVSDKEIQQTKNFLTFLHRK